MKTLFVGNLPYSWDQVQLMDLFLIFNPLRARIITDRKTGKSKGFGFVEFYSQKDMLQAMDRLKKAKADGRLLKIFVANPRKHRVKESSGDSFGLSENFL